MPMPGGLTKAEQVKRDALVKALRGDGTSGTVHYGGEAGGSMSRIDARPVAPTKPGRVPTHIIGVRG